MAGGRGGVPALAAIYDLRIILERAHQNQRLERQLKRRPEYHAMAHRKSTPDARLLSSRPFGVHVARDVGEAERHARVMAEKSVA